MMRTDVKRALNSSRKYAGILKATNNIRIQDRFYSKMISDITVVAKNAGISISDASNQIWTKSAQIGPLQMIPGKDY